MRASVIIVSYNSREDLKRCLPSLLPSLGAQDEVIVVDNASSDGSAGWLAQFYPQIHLVNSPDNLGFAGGNNLGAYYANGRYLAFLNPDTVVEPGWLEALIAALESHPEAGLATSKILLLSDPERINTCGNDVHISGITLCRGMGLLRQSFSSQEEVSAASGAAFVIRKDVFEALDGFDERFFMYMEDTDLSWRARLAGYSCLYAPDSIVYHDYTLTFGPLKTYYQERNRYLMLLKCLRLRTLLALLPVLLLAEVVTWGYTLLRDRRNLTNKFKAYAWIARQWRSIRVEQESFSRKFEISERRILENAIWRLDYQQAHPGLAARVSRLIFDPLFFAFRAPLALLRVR